MKEFTDEQLRAELLRRDLERTTQAEEERHKRIKHLEQCLNTSYGWSLINLMLPDHSRTTCETPSPASDPVNVGRCFRCTVEYHYKYREFDELERVLKFTH